MSYRVDIPTLSANEVYTLTFEYEGTETIQLVVGDLTLETTDRRVVFTTTSPVNYIESNVNLTNLNIYEGYYESDDFGGEYTQESYIEGKSLVNLIQSQKHLEFQNRDCGVETFEDNMIKLTITDPSSLTSTWQHGWIKTSANLKVGATYTCVVHVVENSISTKGMTIGASYGTLVHGSANNSLGGGETGTIVFTYTTATATLKDYNGYYDGFCRLSCVGDWQNGSLKYGIMIFEGDYYDYFINNNIPYFEGIGCVKSPKILSETKHRNIMLNTKPHSTTNLITVSDDNTYIYLAEAARYSGLYFKFTQEYLAQYGISNGDKLCIELDGRLIEGTGTQAAKTSTRIGIDACVWSDGTSGIGTVYKNLPENGHYCDYITINGNAGTIGISFLNNPDWTGTNKIYEIQNLRVYKIEDISEMGTYDCCKISTPDDLELYKVNDTTYDKLDLTTGILYKNTGTYVLDETFVDRTSNWEVSIHDTTGNVTFTSRQHGYLRDEHNFPYSLYNNTIVSNADPAYNIVNNNNIEITRPRLYFDVYSNNNYTVIIMPASYNVTTLEELRTWLQNNPMIFNYKLGTPYTEQLSLNPLKSYRNGSITTSSQQLAPTLKTTLPISNKFTTTNLTSGSTYNVYFDGTATKLDAGGTIITDPISPCEVECGGTTLTIEGTDIQNVRVIETNVKNEIGSVCGTTDVELSRITTKCGIHNMFDDYIQGSHNTQWAKDYNCASTRDDTTVKIVGKGSLNYAGYSLVESLPFGTYKLHYKVKVSTIGDKYKVALSSNPNGIPQDAYVPVTDVTSTALVEEQTFVFYKKHITNMLFYTYTNGQEIEYYDISLIKLSDEDITGTDTSSINYSQTISKLEQPIKLRSLGTTYDSYNPVTGELIKRIGVSETDGSYSVLSSPIVGKLEKSCSFMGNLATSDQLLVYNGATKNGDVITLNKVNKWSLVQLVGSCTRMEKGKQYMCILHDIVGDMTGVVFVRQQDTSIDILPIENNRVIFTAMSNASNRWCFIQQNEGIPNGGTVSFKVSIIEYFEGAEKLDIPYFNTYEQRDLTLQLLPPTCPQLYTNGQVKVYSESEVYPTTILNGQSTNNYEVNELNTSNNYTIRYDGECESINLANKSNEQGTNRIVKSGTDGRGNLTFVNNSEDIDNVLLVQNDVREQEINHFNGLQTVEVNQLFISNKQNLFEQYMKADYDYITDLRWGTQQYSSLHNGVFKCGELVGGENLQMAWNLIKPHADNVYGSKLKEDNPIVLANKVYNISFNISIVDHHTVNGNHNYTIRAFDFDGNGVSVQKATGGQASLSTWSNGVTNPTPKGHINQNVIFSKDVYCFTLHADYGGAWAFDCTITDFTICEPEYAKPDVPLVYEYIDLPQPVQLNSLPDGTCDTYNLITGEYVQNVGYAVYDDTTTWNSYAKDFYYTPCPSDFDFYSSFIVYHRKLESTVASKLWAGNSGYAISSSVMMRVIGLQSKEEFLEYVNQYPMKVVYKRTEPITTQLTPVNIPTFDGGILQLITTDGKVFPMVEYSMPTNNRYDTSSWEAGAVYTQRNMTEAYFNDSTTPMTPTETMTLTTDHISSGSIILNDNGNGLIVLNGDYTGRDIPYFTGMRSVEAIEVETTPSPDQPLFGKGGRK